LIEKNLEKEKTSDEHLQQKVTAAREIKSLESPEAVLELQQEIKDLTEKGEVLEEKCVQ
jgi:hypothetical protein